jgi:hypothetical protein
LQQLLPHLLLATAQESDVARKGVTACQKQAAEGDEFVKRAADIGPVTEIAPQIHKAVSCREARGQFRMESGEAYGLAMDRSDRPDANGPQETREDA